MLAENLNHSYLTVLSPPARFFRGKPAVRCYHPVRVPRVAVRGVPTPDCASRSVSLVWGY